MASGLEGHVSWHGLRLAKDNIISPDIFSMIEVLIIRVAGRMDSRRHGHCMQRIGWKCWKMRVLSFGCFGAVTARSDTSQQCCTCLTMGIMCTSNSDNLELLKSKKSSSTGAWRGRREKETE